MAFSSYMRATVDFRVLAIPFSQKSNTMSANLSEMPDTAAEWHKQIVDADLEAMKDEKAVLGVGIGYAGGSSFSAEVSSASATVALCSVVILGLATADRFMYGKGSSDDSLENAPALSCYISGAATTSC